MPQALPVGRLDRRVRGHSQVFDICEPVLGEQVELGLLQPYRGLFFFLPKVLDELLPTAELKGWVGPSSGPRTSSPSAPGRCAGRTTATCWCSCSWRLGESSSPPVTVQPDQKWVNQQARDFLLEIEDGARGVLIQDRDTKFQPSFDGILESEEPTDRRTRGEDAHRRGRRANRCRGMLSPFEV